MSGYFGIGILQGKTIENTGTLWRGAFQLGAAFIFTIGERYKRQASDNLKTWRHVPLFNHDTVASLMSSTFDCVLVCVEMGGTPLPDFVHPTRAIYLLGAEDRGLPDELLERCKNIVSIPSIGRNSYNVAQAGTLIMYDRMCKRQLE